MNLILATMLTLAHSTARNVESLIPGQHPFAAPPHSSSDPSYVVGPEDAACPRHGEAGPRCRRVLRRAG